MRPKNPPRSRALSHSTTDSYSQTGFRGIHYQTQNISLEIQRIVTIASCAKRRGVTYAAPTNTSKGTPVLSMISLARLPGADWRRRSKRE